MNLADQKIDEMYQSILQIDASSMTPEKWENYKSDALMYFSKKYKNDMYTWALMISLEPWSKEFSETAIWIINMELKHAKNLDKRFGIIYSPSKKGLTVEKWTSTIYTRSENNRLKYPRTRDPDSLAEQYKVHKIVAWWVNALQKLLLSPIPDPKQNQAAIGST